MSVFTDSSVPGNLTDDATWQSWAQKTAALFEQAGLTKTPDTGQVDLTTATRPATNSYAGYEIRKLNDSLAGTAPIFVKVEYGSGSTLGAPQMRFNFGTGTDGAGNLTGLGLATANVTMTQNGTAASGSASSTADDGVFAFCHPGTASQSIYALLIERFKDSDGTPNTKGYQVCVVSGASSAPNCTEYTVSFEQNGARSQRTYFPILYSPDSGVEGTATGAYPLQVIHGLQHPPSLGFVGVKTSDLGPGVTMTITRYGVSRTYKQMAPIGFSAQVGAGTHLNMGLAMLFD